VSQAKPKNGRPTKYKAEFNDKVFRLSLLGLTDSQLADSFSISEATFNNWKNKHPLFLESIKAGKEDADAKVAASLYQRALGYSHPEDKIFNNNGEEMIVPTTKHYPPDTAAAFIWLKNRAGWRDKTEVENTAKVTIIEMEHDEDI
jgi:hypothetical protein